MFSKVDCAPVRVQDYIWSSLARVATWRPHENPAAVLVAVCARRCYNRGTCVGYNECRCVAGYAGNVCQTGRRTSRADVTTLYRNVTALHCDVTTLYCDVTTLYVTSTHCIVTSLHCIVTSPHRVNSSTCRL